MKILAVAIVLGAAFIAGAILLSNRYKLERANDLAVWRIDQLRVKLVFAFGAAQQRKCVSVPDARLLSDKEIGLPDDLISPKEP